ncbi:MAG: hypothetical protein M3R55_08835 [Acidobacteriota bacterium]|nr:hypothetical protein [Acidobacteriota bacterium]
MRKLTTLTLTILLGAAASANAQATQTPPPPPAQTPPAAQTPAAPAEPAIGFKSDSGMMFNVIKKESTADFEMVLGRLREALQKSENPQRKLQAASWKVFKATDPTPDGSIMYVFLFDDVVKGADYDPVKILSEAFPTEVNALYEKLKTAYAALNKAELAKLMDMKIQ